MSEEREVSDQIEVQEDMVEMDVADTAGTVIEKEQGSISSESEKPAIEEQEKEEDEVKEDEDEELMIAEEEKVENVNQEDSVEVDDAHEDKNEENEVEENQIADEADGEIDSESDSEDETEAKVEILEEEKETKMELGEEPEETPTESQETSGEPTETDKTQEDAVIRSEDGEISEVEEKVEEKPSKRERKSERSEKSEKKDKKKHKSSKHRRRSRSRSPHRHHRRSRSSSPVNAESSRNKSLSPIRHSRDHNGHSNGSSRRHQNNGDPKRKTVLELEKDILKNPALLQNRCQQVVQIGENQAAQISDDELRKYIKEAVSLVRELDKYHGKRELLKDELKEMSKREMELIKKIHSELPRHMQSVLRVEGNSVHISQERSNGVFPFGLMPPPPFGMPPGMMGMPPPDGLKFPPPFPPIPGMFAPPPNFPMGPPPPFANNRSSMPNLMQPPPKVPSPSALESKTPPPSLAFNKPPPVPQGFPDFSKPPPIPPIIENADSSKETSGVKVPTSNAATSSAAQPFRPSPSDMPEISNKLTSMLTNALKAHVTQRPQSPFKKSSPSASHTPPVKSAVPSLMSVPIREPPNLALQRGIAATRKRLMDED